MEFRDGKEKGDPSWSPQFPKFLPREESGWGWIQSQNGNGGNSLGKVDWGQIWEGIPRESLGVSKEDLEHPRIMGSVGIAPGWDSHKQEKF